MLEKAPDPENQTRLKLRLTPKGEKAYRGHAAMHRQFDILVEELLSGATDQDRAFLTRFLDDLERALERI